MSDRRPFSSHPDALVVEGPDDKPVEDYHGKLDSLGKYPVLMNNYIVSPHALRRDDGEDFILSFDYRDGEWAAFVDLNIENDLDPEDEDVLPTILLFSMANRTMKDSSGADAPTQFSKWAKAYMLYHEKKAADMSAPETEAGPEPKSAQEFDREFDEAILESAEAAPPARRAISTLPETGALEVLPQIAAQRAACHNKYAGLGMVVLDAYLSEAINLGQFAEQLQIAFHHEDRSRRIQSVVVEEARADRVTLVITCREASGKAISSHKAHITARLFEFDVRVTGRKKYEPQRETCEFVQEQVTNVLEQRI